jgi:hypothetical protein
MDGWMDGWSLNTAAQIIKNKRILENKTSIL